MGILDPDPAEGQVALEHLEVGVGELVHIAGSPLVHDLSDADDLAVEITNCHADQGMGLVSSLDVDIPIESRVLEID